MAAIFLAGIAAGAINTVVGSGTLITFPTLLAVGVPPVTANVSNTLGLVPGSLSGRDRLPARAGRPAAAAAAARQRRRCSAGSPARAAAGAARGGVPGDRPGADRAGLRAGRAAADDQPPGRRPRRSPRRRAARSTAPPWVWLLVYVAGVYGGYFGAAQGVLLMAILGHRPHRDDAAQQRHQERAGDAGQPGRGGRVHLRAPTWTGRSSALIAVGSVIGGQLGATVGRRLPSWALRAFIVVVGVAALTVVRPVNQLTPLRAARPDRSPARGSGRRRPRAPRRPGPPALELVAAGADRARVQVSTVTCTRRPDRRWCQTPRTTPSTSSTGIVPGLPDGPAPARHARPG